MYSYDAVISSYITPAIRLGGKRGAGVRGPGMWKTRDVENAGRGKRGVWKTRGVENAGYGKRGVWWKTRGLVESGGNTGSKWKTRGKQNFPHQIEKSKFCYFKLQ